MGECGFRIREDACLARVRTKLESTSPLSAVRQSLKRKEEHSRKRLMWEQSEVALLGMLFFPFLNSHMRVGGVDSRFALELSILALIRAILAIRG